MTLADLPQVQALSAREKLQLVDELWLEVAHHLESLDATSEEKQMLDDRWNRFLTNPDSALNLEDFQKRLKALRA
jgi:putative addiction module component (TIGR02574 family)